MAHSSHHEAHTRAVKLREAKQYQSATHYFLNALGTTPGHIGIIQDFATSVHQFAREVATCGDIGQASALLQWAEGFMLEQVPHVSVEHVETLLGLAREFSNQRQALEADDEPVDARSDELEDTLRTLEAGTYDERVPSDVGQFEAKIRQLEAIQEAVSDAPDRTDSEVLVRIDSLLHRWRAVRQFDSLTSEAADLLLLAESQENPTTATYGLQLCENVARQLVPLTPFVDPGRRAGFEALLARLRLASERLAEQSRLKESEIIWARYEAQAGRDLQALTWWSAPKIHFPDKQCQQQICTIQQLLKSAQEAAARISHPETIGKAVKQIDELNRALGDVSRVQYRIYNQWALEQIQTCYQEAQEHLSFISDDEKNLATVIVDRLGPIDQRFLTFEVQRCFSEVFESLYRELNGPKKDKDDFVKPGRKLKALKDMLDKNKRELADF